MFGGKNSFKVWSSRIHYWKLHKPIVVVAMFTQCYATVWSSRSDVLTDVYIETWAELKKIFFKSLVIKNIRGAPG